VRHLHNAVHLVSRGQFSTGSFRLSSLTIQGAKAAVTVRLEGAHAEFIRKCECLLVVVFGLLDIWQIAMRYDVSEAPQCPCLVSQSLASAVI
jgi:hypothetical protein